jgi:hypothetical protein
MSYLKSVFKKMTKSELFIRAVSVAAYWYVRFIAATTRWDRRNVRNFYDTLDRCGSVIFVAWHGRMPMLPYFWDRRKTLKALVSPHRDGRMIVGLLKRFGIGHIDGSSNENAVGSAVALMHELNNDTTIAIIPDGPRGPSMTMSMSPIYYAQKTGKPVIGVTYAVARSKVLTRCWDQMLVPFPFQKGICAVTEPMFVPQTASRDEMENYRRRFEDELNALTWQIDRELGLPPVSKGIKARQKRKVAATQKGTN